MLRKEESCPWEECALSTGRTTNDAVVRSVIIEKSMEECALSLGMGAKVNVKLCSITEGCTNLVVKG